MNTDISLANTEQAIADIAAGKMVILLDDESRENEGDLIIAAEHATADAINFMATYGKGLICITLSENDFTRLGIPLMATQNKSPLQTAFGVGFEAADGVTTGISAFDRARTVAAAIEPHAGPEAITMPGHMFPLRARDGGVLVRNGHTEGSTDLARLGGCYPSAVLCEIMRDDGHMARTPDLIEFAKHHQLTITTIQDLIDYRLRNEIIYEAGPAARLPVEGLGECTVQTFHSHRDQQDHLAIVVKNTDFSRPCLVRLHSECLTGDALGSLRCDCGKQLQRAKEMMQEAGGGVLLYLRQEGRGIGIAEKIKAYALQDEGMDTVEANLHLGHDDDARDYGIAAQILKALNIQQVRLLTNNPHKIARLEHLGVDVVERVPLEIEASNENVDYLQAKKIKLGHILDIKKEDK